MLNWFTPDLATRAQAIIELTALVLAILFYFFDYKRDKKKHQEEEQRRRKDQHDRKLSLLASLKQEIELNWTLLHNPALPVPHQYHPRYYNPTVQVFKYRDDAIVLALSQVESDVLLDAELAQTLLMVSYNIRFVNQQIDELMTYRFGSPERLAEASELVRRDAGLLHRFATASDKIKPKRLRPYFQELALRHWAIVNEGYWKRLKPSLEALRQPLNRALQQVGLGLLGMPRTDEVYCVSTPASITGDVGDIAPPTDDSQK